MLKMNSTVDLSDLRTDGAASSKTAKAIISLLCWVLVLTLLLGTRAYSYLLFHSVTEIFSVVIAFSIFVLAWNSRQYADNQYLIFLGIGSLFVGLLDGIHTLAYKGMGIFPGYGANLPTQLWIAARLLGSLSFLAASLFIKRRVHVGLVFWSYTLITALLLITIFHWQVFPDCFLEPGGLTRFKVISEYFIIAVLTASSFLLFRQRQAFEPDILRLLTWSIALIAASELCFTLYRDVYDILNMAGHLLKVTAFYLIYRGLVVTGITRPQGLLFRNLQENEARYRTILETAMDGFWRVDLQGRLLEVNEAYCRMSGYQKAELLSMRIADLELIETPEKIVDHLHKIMLQGEHRFETKQRRKDGSILNLQVSVQYKPAAGKTMVAFLHDITQRKQSEENLRQSQHLLESIRQAQTKYIMEGEVSQVYGELLQTMVELTNSEYGFLDEVVYPEEGEPYKISLALSDISWDENSRRLFDELKSHNLVFRNLNNLAGAPVLSGKQVIANEAAADPRSGGMPSGHPDIYNFMGIPMFFGKEMVGVAGVANRLGGYSKAEANFLEPFVNTCAAIIHAERFKQKEYKWIEALAESEHRMNATINAVTESIFLMSADGTVELANDYAAKRFGKNPQEIVGQSIFALLPPETAAFRRQKVEEALHSGQPLQFEDSRGPMEFLHSLYPVKNSQGKVSHLAIFAMDITDRKQVERDLERMHKIQSEGQKIAHMGTFEYIADTQTTVWSDEEYRIYGLDPAGPSPAYDVMLEKNIHPEDADLLHQTFMAALQNITVYELEHRIIRPDGSVRWVYDRAHPYFDEHGKLIRYIGTTLDITERKHSEAALGDNQARLAEANQILAGVLEHTHMMAVFLDPQFNFIWVNRAYAQTCQHEPSFFPGRNHFELYPDPDNKAIFQRVVDTGEPFFATAKPFEFPDQPGRGVTYWDWSLIPVKNDRVTVTGLVFTLAEVTGRIQAEQKLKKSEERFRLTVENAPAAIFIQAQYRFAYLNPAAIKLFGAATGEQLLGSPVIDRFHPKFHEVVRERIRLLNEEQQIMPRMEQKYLKLDGTEIDVEVSAVPFVYENHNGALVFVQDISERKRAEEKIEASRAKLEAALASMNDAVVISDTEGRFIDFNEAFAIFHKFKNKDGCAKTLAEYPIFLDVFLAHGELAPLEQWAVPRALKGETVSNAEYTLRRKDTCETWVGSYSFAPIRDKGGEIVGSVVVGRDITEQKQAELALRRSEQRLRLAQDAAQAGTWEWDLLTNENYWSEEIWPLYELKPFSCQPSYASWLQTVYPDDRQKIEQVIREAVSSEKELNIEWRVNSLSGAKRWLMSRGRPFYDVNGRIVRYLGIVMDITQRKLAEEALSKSLEEKTALLKEVHHRVKNNLQIVASLLSMQMSRSPNLQVVEALQETGNRVRSMALLHEVLYSSGNLAGINFAAYVTELCKYLQQSFNSPRVIIENRISPIGLPMEISLPCGLIINELVSNALKYAFPDERQGHITLELAREQNNLILGVQDNGVGLPADININNISTLGLRLVYRLTEQLDGRLTITQTDGTGVAFKISFPVTQDLNG